MAVDQTSKFCGRCKKHTLHARPGTNHLAHALITLFLCGFWLPIWILASLKIGGWKCQTCGYGGSSLVRIGLAVGCVVLFLGVLSIVANRVGHNGSTPQVVFHSPPKDIPAQPRPTAKDDSPPEAKTTEAKPKPAQQTNPPNTPEKHNYKEGEDVHVGYTSYGIWRSWWSNRLSENQFLNQGPNAMYLFVELSVRNNDKKPRMIPVFTLIDDSGAEYQASSNGWAVQGSIGLIESLNPSVSKQGFIIFDVPQNRNYRLKLSGGYWSLADAFVQLAPKASQEDAGRAEQDQQSEETRAKKKRQAEAKQQADKERRAADEATKWRTWTDSTGTHKTEAKWGGMAFGKVKLIKRDGSAIHVPFEKLSDDDQQWIKDRKR